MKKIFCLICLAAFLGCNSNAPAKDSAADSSYRAITDSSALTKDSLAIPDSSTPNLSH